MRITNNQIFTRSMQDMSKTQQRLNTAHTQVTSLDKFRTSADAPADVAKSSYLEDEIGKNTQYQKNGTMLRSTLGLEEATLNNLHTAMERGRVLSFRALNGTVDDLDLKAISIEVNEVQKEIFSLVNTKNANGDHIFSGSASKMQAYVWDENSSKYNYRGNEQDNDIQIATNVFVRSGDNGRKVFESSPARLVAQTENVTGAVSAARVRVIDQGEYDDFHDDNYDYANPANNTFKLNVLPPAVAGSSDTFEILDRGNNLLQSGNFTSDKKIRFNGLHITATGGSPGSIDITMTPPSNENILNTLEELKNVLTDPSLTIEEFQDGMADAQIGIENAKYSAMSVMSSIGGRNNTTERVTESNESFKIINQEAMAILTEADLAAAMTDLTKEQNLLEMSYQSFNKINNLSLFNSIT
jgi:flagellar hook-associated protein 3 FlgL